MKLKTLPKIGSDFEFNSVALQLSQLELPNSTHFNFVELLSRILEWWISYLLVYSATLIVIFYAKVL